MPDPARPGPDRAGPGRALMAGIGALMTAWAGGLTLLRG